MLKSFDYAIREKSINGMNFMYGIVCLYEVSYTNVLKSITHVIPIVPVDG